MEAQKFIVPNMAQGLKTIRETLGEEALIISKQQTSQGVEIIATVAKEPHLNALSTSADVLLGAQTKQRQDALLDIYKEKIIDKPMQTPLAKDSSLDTMQPKVSMAPVYHDAQVLNAFQSQLDGIKQVLDAQYSDFCWHEYGLKNAYKVKVIKELEGLGFSQAFCKEMLEPLPNTADLPALRQACVQSIIESVLAEHQSIDWSKGRHVFVGPGGAGKTQALCKCLPSILKQYNNEDVLLISYNENRLGQFDKLMVYANIFQVEATLVDDQATLAKTLSRAAHKKVVIMDLCLQDMDALHATIESFNQNHCGFIPVGVIPANLEQPMMHRFALNLKNLNTQHVIHTKFDETQLIGSSLETVIGMHFSLSACFQSSLLTEDLIPISQTSLCQLFEHYKEYTYHE